MGAQLVLLLFQILDRLVLLFQRFVGRKNMRRVELQSESVFPTGKVHLLAFSSSIDVFDAYLSSAVFAR